MQNDNLIEEARGFAEWWRDNPQNSDVIYAIVRMVDGDAVQRQVTASGLDRLADALEVAEKRATEAEAERAIVERFLTSYKAATKKAEAERDALEEQMQDREMLVMLLRNTEQERDEFKRLFAECHPIHLDGVQRAYVAEKELRDRELHHFEVEQELAAALAVIEEAREWRDPAYEAGWGSPDDYANGYRMALRNIRRILSSVPADVLRERDAKKWDECVQEAFDLGWLHEHAAKEMRARNPYRQTEEETDA